MRSTRWMVSLTLTLLSAPGLVAGCSSRSATTAPPASATAPPLEDDEAAEDLAEHARHHHHGGVMLFFAMSVDTLGVAPEQQNAVARIQADLFAKLEPARAAEQDVVTTLADGIAAGGIDHAKVDSAVARVASTSGGLHDATADALNQLHAVLTPEQRSALVEKVEAHWDVWKHANAVEAEKAGGDASRAAQRGHLDVMAKEIELSPEQVARAQSNFDAAMGAGPPRLDPAEIQGHIDAIGAAFRADTFDAKLIEPASQANAHLAGWGAARMARFYEALDPVLTPPQRAKVAEMLREHATHNESTAAK